MLSFSERSRLFRLDQDSPEWCLTRGKFVTSSVLPGLLGRGYKGKAPSVILEWGKKHEDECAVAASGQYSVAVRPGLLVHEKDQRFACSIDRIILRNGKLCILECKCVFPGAGHLRAGKLPETAEAIKDYVVIQVLFQMMVASVPEAVLAYWHPSGHRIFLIKRNGDFDAFIHEQADRIYSEYLKPESSRTNFLFQEKKALRKEQKGCSLESTPYCRFERILARTRLDMELIEKEDYYSPVSQMPDTLSAEMSVQTEACVPGEEAAEM